MKYNQKNETRKKKNTWRESSHGGINRSYRRIWSSKRWWRRSEELSSKDLDKKQKLKMNKFLHFLFCFFAKKRRVVNVFTLKTFWGFEILSESEEWTNYRFLSKLSLSHSLSSWNLFLWLHKGGKEKGISFLKEVGVLVYWTVIIIILKVMK